MNLVKNELHKICKKKFIYISLLILVAITLILAISTNKQYRQAQLFKKNSFLSEIESAIEFYEEKLRTFDETKDELDEKKNIINNINYNMFLLENKIPQSNWKARALKHYFLNTDRYYLFENGDIAYTDALNPQLCYKYVIEDDFRAYLQLEAENYSYIINKGYDGMGLYSRLLNNIEKAIEYDIEPNMDSWQYEYINRAESLRAEAINSRESYLIYQKTEPEIRALEIEADKIEYRVRHNKPIPEEFSLYNYFYNTLDVIIIISIIISLLASNILSFEYEGDTYIQLYSYPYKRWKIVLSKFFALVIISIILLAIVFIVMIISGLSLYGLRQTDYVMLVNASKGLSGIKELNIIIYTAILFLLSISEMVMVIVLCMAISSLFNKTVLSSAIGVGLVLIGQSYATIFSNIYRITGAKYIFSIVMNMRQFFVSIQWWGKGSIKKATHSCCGSK